MSEEDIYRQMAEKIMMKGSTIIPRLFRMIADSEEAELMMAMPGTPEQLAEKVGKPVEQVEEMCKNLYRKGVAFKSFKTGSLGYKMCRDLVQFHDASILWPEAPQEYLDLWQKFMEEEWPNYAKIVEKIMPKPFTRVIPIDKAVEAGKQQVLDTESAEKMIQDSEKVAVTKCTCRLTAHKCDNPLEVCLQIGKAADYTIDRESGREVSRDEAYEILKKSEDAGLVHITLNKAHAGHFICNCCGCCCQTLPLLISEGLKLTDPSRYTARIDAGLCDFCGACRDRCYFNAVVEAKNDEGEEVMSIIEEKCMGCGLCYVTCPEGAISLVETRPEDFIPA